MTPYYVPREDIVQLLESRHNIDAKLRFCALECDDIRSADAFIEGYHALHSSAELVDFPYTRVILDRRFGVLPRERRG